MARKPTTTKHDFKFDPNEDPDYEPHPITSDDRYVTIGFRAPRTETTLDRLDVMARKHGNSRAFMVRRMVMYCLEKWEAQQGTKNG